MLAVVGALGATSQLLGASKTWIGPGFGSWSTSSDWSPSGVPVGGDDVIFSENIGNDQMNGSYSIGSPINSLTVTGHSTNMFASELTQSSTTLAAGTESFSGPGIYAQTGGLNNASSTLTLGAGTISGTFNYLLEPASAGTLNVGTMIVGGNGAAVFTQSGGVSTFTSSLIVGNSAGSAGTFSLSGGTMTTSNMAAIGNDGAGTYLQSGGVANFGGFGLNTDSGGYASISAGTLISAQTDIGDASAATFSQSGGYTSLGAISLSDFGSGMMILSAGTMIATSLDTGYIGSGTFMQSGSLSVSSLGAVDVSSGEGGANGNSTYMSLSDGSLTATSTTVGDSSTGTFSQNSGSSSLGLLTVGTGTAQTGIPGATSFGTLLLSGGSLQALDSVIGVFGSSGFFLQSGGSSNLVGITAVGQGSTSTGTLSLTGGTLTATDMIVGYNFGSGTFLQSGSLSVSDLGTLTIGAGTGGVGTVSLSAGSMTASTTNVGSLGGTGSFVQSGGVATFGLTVGNGTSSYGTFQLTGGSLSCSSQIGYFGGIGTFIQTGGFNSAGLSYVGFGTGAFGTFSIAGGSMSAFGVVVGADGGTGYFYQCGSQTVGNDTLFNIALGTNSSGLVSVSGGTLDAGLMVGVRGAGTFLQSGSQTVTNLVTLVTFGIATSPGSSGYVSLNGGSLLASGYTSTRLGNGGNGTFLQSGSQTFSNIGSLSIGATGNLALSGGTMLINNVISAGTVSITGGTLAITGAGSLGGSSINSTGLSISGPGVLDVGSSGIVIEYGSGTSPVGDLSFARTARNYPAGSIQRYAQTAFNGFAWNGPGLTSSYAANDPNGLTAVGIADENDLDNVYPSDYTVAGGGPGTWMGQPINDPNNVLVRMTWYGDGNDDGVVNRLDVSALSQGYNGIAGYVGWSDGDYTYSGDITKVDVGLLAQSYLFQGAPLGDAITAGQAQYLMSLDPEMPANVMADFRSIAGVPEPAVVGLLGAAGVGLMGRRRRRRD